jgi:O-antigen biosynthesis protein
MDRPSGLARCLEAILSGTKLPAAIIVVDQGIGDEAPVVAADYANRGTPIVFRKEPPRGLSASRNRALSLARSAFVAVTDDDCVPHVNWIAALSESFGVFPEPDAVTGRVLPFGQESPGRHAVSSRTSTTGRDFRGRSAAPWEVGSGANLAVNRECIRRIGPYDERLGVGTRARAAEDIDMIYRLLCGGALIRYAPDAVVYHERQTTARRRASRSGYGTGIGTFCTLTAKTGDWRAGFVLLRWFVFRAQRIGQAVTKRRFGTVRDELLVLVGTCRGVALGLCIRKREQS